MQGQVRATEKIKKYLNIFIERVIFWNAKGYGWSIGETAFLVSGTHWHKSGLDSDEPWQGKWERNVTVDCIEEVIEELEVTTMADEDDVSGTGVINSKQSLLLWYVPLLYLAQCVNIFQSGLDAQLNLPDF